MINYYSFVREWYGREEPPDYCAVVVVCGKPVDVIAFGDTYDDAQDRVRVECARQHISRKYVDIIDMRVEKVLFQGALEILRESEAQQPAYLILDHGVWYAEVDLGCCAHRKPWPSG